MSDTTARSKTFQRLARRNRFVSLLRILVPVLGVAVFAALCLQLVLASIGGRFEVGKITVTPEAIVVDAPEYVGVLPDGSRYRVSSEGARSSNDRRDYVDLIKARLVMDRADGVQFIATTNDAELDTARELTRAHGLTEVSDSTGTTGTITNSTFDWRSQVLTSEGRVEIDYADGTTIRAEGLVYNAETAQWIFTRSVVTVPSTPGEGAQTLEGETP